MAMKYEWVLFDLDGTLAESIEQLFLIYCDFLKSHGRSGTKEEFNTLNGTISEIVFFLMKEHSISGSFALLEKEYYELLLVAYHKNIMPFEHAEMVLKSLQMEGHNLGLVTSARKELVNAFLNRCNWDKFFKLVVCGDDVPKGKPAPNIFYHACHEHGINRDKVVVVEDSRSGFLSAINAGLFCLRVDNSRFKLTDVLVHVKGNLPLDYSQWFNVVSGGSVKIVQSSDHTMYSSVVSRVDQIWVKETSKNPKLFNGKTFSYVSHEKYDDETRVVGSFIEYKYFLAQLREPILDLGIKPIGVSGLVLLNDKEEKIVVFALRDDYVTQYPGCIELVPSGTIDVSSVLPNGEIDVHAALRKEFAEETGLSVDCISRMKDIGFVLDRRDQVYDVCVLIQVNATKEQVLDSFSRVSEYNSPCFVRLDDIPHFVKENAHTMVPSSIAILHAVMAGELK